MYDAAIPELPPFAADCALSPEFRLAVACSWIAPGPLERRQSEEVSSLWEAGIDQDAFLALINLHCLPVQAYTVLRRCLGPEVPERLGLKLKERSRKTAIRSAMQLGELIRVNRLMRNQGIEMIPLKGIALSQRLYGAPGVRTCGDLDVLIRPENLGSADRILVSAGYRRQFDLTERQKAAFFAHAHHVSYRSEKSGVHLELHWRGQFWSGEDLAEFWRGTEFLALAGEAFRYLPAPHLFMFLCYHGSFHNWSIMKWAGDIAMMLAGGTVNDWNDVVILARRMGMERVLAQASLLAHWLYGIPLPSHLAGLIVRDRTPVRLARKALEQLLAGRDGLLSQARPLAGLRHIVYLKRLRPNLPISLMLKGCFICPLDYLAFPLPDRLFWLYVPLRPVLWFLRHFCGNPLGGRDGG